MVPGDRGTTAERSYVVPARVLILALARVSMLVVLVLPATVTPPSAVARSTQAAIDTNDPVPVPADLTALEPQVRAYLQPFIEKARNAPQDPDARATLGLVYAANGLWTPARACFAEALRSAPSNRQAHYYLGIATAALGDFDASLAIYRDVAARFPDFAPCQHRLGDALLMAGDSDGAMGVFERTIKLAPTKPHGFAGLGDVKLRGRDFAGAAEALERAVGLDRRDRMGHYLLGLAYRGLGRREDAKRELALGLNATRRFMPDPWTLPLAEHARGLADQMELARRYMAAGQYKRAAQILENAMKWHSSNIELINELAVARLNLRDPAGARDLLLRAAEIDDAHATTRINLAACHMGLGLFDSALEYIDRAVVLAPDVPRVYFTRSGVLKALGRDADALEALAEAARLDPMSAIYRLHLGDTSAKLGLRAQAKDHFRASASIDPSMLAPQLGLAELCLVDGDTACAREAYEQAKRIAPNDSRVLELTARIERH